MTSTYLVNPSFETLRTKDNSNDVTVKTKLENGLYGWEISTLKNDKSSNYQVESAASGSSTGFPSTGGSINPTDGTYYYFNRQGWGNISGEIKTTTSTALPAGTYYAVIDYKAADYSNNNNANKNGTTLGFKVTDESGTNVLGENPAVRRSYSMTNISSNPGTDDYMVAKAWDKLGVVFTVATESKVTLSIQENLVNSGRSDIILDNLKLYQVSTEASTDGFDLSSLVSCSNYYMNGGWNDVVVNTWSTEDEGVEGGMTVPFLQSWVADGQKLADQQIAKSLTGLPSGNYKVSIFSRAMIGGGSTEAPSGATFTANGVSTDLCAGASAGISRGTFSVETTVGAAGTLDLAIAIASANFNWFSFKDVKLEYFGQGEVETSLGSKVVAQANNYFVGATANIEVTYPYAISESDVLAMSDDANITINDTKVEATFANGKLSIPVSTAEVGQYTVTIPAGTVGFLNAGVTNEEISLTYEVVTPIIATQKCYLSTEVDGVTKYLSRGDSWQTRSIIDDYGIAVELNVPSADNPNQVTVKYTDSDMFMGDAGNYNIYGDKSAWNWVLIPEGDGYYIGLTNDAGAYVGYSGNQVKVVGTPVLWKLTTDAEHDATVAKLAPAHKKAMLDAAGYTEEDLTKYTTLKEVSTPVEGNGENYQGQTDGKRELTLLSQDYTGLAAGLYKVSVQAFQRTTFPGTMTSYVSQGFDDPTALLMANNESVRLKSVFTDAQTEQVNGGSGEVNYSAGETTYYIPDNMTASAAYFNKGLYNNEVYVNVGGEGTLNVKIVNASYAGEKRGEWFYFNNYIKVEKVEEKTLAVDEASTGNAITAGDYMNVNLTRTIKADVWNTFCSPCDITAEELSKAGITAVKALTGATVSTGKATLTFTEATAIEAGKPYMVKGAATTAISLKRKTVVTTPTATTIGDVSFVPTFNKTTINSNEYFINNNLFYQATGDVTVKGMRAYITLPEEAAANIAFINIDGEVTGVTRVEGADEMVNVVTLDGVVVRKNVKSSQALDGLQKGIYVINGKKYVK